MSTRPISIASVPEPDAALGLALVQLQKDVWGSEPDDVLPSWRFVVTPRTGGELLVAHAGDELVGFALCSPGSDADGVYLYLDLLGVHPACRHTRVGEQLMRELVRVGAQRRIDRIRWTFDPLEGANANLYLAKLGARGIAFLPNLYGAMARAGQEGERSDRLLAELEVSAPEVAEAVAEARDREPQPQIVLDHTSSLPAELPERIALAVPANYAKLRAADPERARAIRLGTGRLLEQLFAAHFSVTGFVRGEDHNVLVARQSLVLGPNTRDLFLNAEGALDVDDEYVRALAGNIVRFFSVPFGSRRFDALRWCFGALSEFVMRDPDVAWRVLLAVLAADPRDEKFDAHRMAGSLNTLIELHGAQFIERIEERARRDPAFVRLFRDLEQGSTPDDIWRRIAAVRQRVS